MERWERGVGATQELNHYGAQKPFPAIRGRNRGFAFHAVFDLLG